MILVYRPISTLWTHQKGLNGFAGAFDPRRAASILGPRRKDGNHDGRRGTDGDVSAKLRSASGSLAADPARAEALAREVLRIVPDNADGLVVLGTALRLQGRLEEGRAVFEPLASAQPRSWIVQFELARVLFGLGESRAAVGRLAAAVALKDDLAAAWQLSGDIALAAGDPAAAQRAYDHLLAAANREPRLKAAAGALAEGRPSEAERLARSVIAAAPNSTAAKHLLAEAAARRGRLAEAENLLAACLAAAPDLNLVRHAYAGVLAAIGKIRPALVELDRLLALDPADHRARMAKLAALTALGDHEAAALVTAQIVQDFPDQPQAWLTRGAGLRALGRVDEAVLAGRRALALAPGDGEAWWSLASLETHRFDTADRAAMQAALANANGTARDASRLHYALGRADEEVGRFGEAFDHYVRGGAIERRLSAYDPARMSEFLRRSQNLFTGEFFARRTGWGEAAPGPIFIVGLPRSGSTLVDQILVSHSERRGSWGAVGDPGRRRLDGHSQSGGAGGGLSGLPGGPGAGRVRPAWTRICGLDRGAATARDGVVHRQGAGKPPSRRPYQPHPAQRQDHRCPPPSPGL